VEDVGGNYVTAFESGDHICCNLMWF